MVGTVARDPVVGNIARPLNPRIFLLGLATMRGRIALLIALAAPLMGEPKLGVIQFPNSGSAAAQEPFLRGVLLLHSFEYDDAAVAFQEAQKADASFALSYWGEALSHYRPVWGRENFEKGRAALAKGSQADTAIPRERRYLEAAKIAFGEESREQRWQRYSDAMGRLSSAHPDDLEAMSLHAVSLFGVTGSKRDHRTYMRIASIAEQVYRKNPDHPGALHYLIHAFDDPVHAPLGLPYARRYAGVASAAPHAQHMPSHVFLALGMWDECISSNVDSWNSSEDRVKRLGLGSDDRGYHALWWLQYSYLQKGLVSKARDQLSVIEADVARAGSRHSRNHQAYLRSHFLVETGQWTSDLAPVKDKGLDNRAWGANALAEGIRAIKTGNINLARKWHAKLREKAASHGQESTSLPIAALELEGLLLLKEREADKGLEKLREATVLEEGTPFGYGPPFPVKPAFELLGEALLGLDRPKEALKAFETSLGRTPRRALSLIGLQNAAEAVGDKDTASWAEGELQEYRSN